MMNRTKTAKVYLVRFLYALPMLLVLLAMFRTDIEALGQNPAPEGTFALVETDYVYIAGIIFDGNTGQPLANLNLEGSMSPVMIIKGEERPQPEILGTITTDADGFYYWKVDIRNQEKDYVNYHLQPTDKRYEEISIGGTFDSRRSNAFYTNFKVLFYTENLMDRLKRDYYVVLPPDYSEKVPTDLEPGSVKQFIQSKLPEFTAEHTLKIDFKKAYWKPRDVITKFREGYFNKDRELIGYVGMTEFYLDGKKVPYEEINREFIQKRITVMQKDFSLASFRGLEGKIFYQTFRNFEDAPPAELVNGSTVEWVAVTNFDVAILENEPYMLDGFRQVPGTSSNLMPLKEEIVRVAILKNKLARYFAPKLDKLWWIETRPPAEVQGRPEFAGR